MVGNTLLLIGLTSNFALYGAMVYNTTLTSKNAIFERKYCIHMMMGERTVTPCIPALKLKPLIAEKAKENQVASGGAVPQKSAKPIDTREELAKIAGVSHDTIHKVEVIQKKASPEVRNNYKTE